MDKMAAVLADNIFKCIFLIENGRISIQISLKFVPWSPIDNYPGLSNSLVPNRPLPKLMMTQVHWRIYAALGGDEYTLCIPNSIILDEGNHFEFGKLANFWQLHLEIKELME